MITLNIDLWDVVFGDVACRSYPGSKYRLNSVGFWFGVNMEWVGYVVLFVVLFCISLAQDDDNYEGECGGGM